MISDDFTPANFSKEIADVFLLCSYGRRNRSQFVIDKIPGVVNSRSLIVFNSKANEPRRRRSVITACSTTSAELPVNNRFHSWALSSIMSPPSGTICGWSWSHCHFSDDTREKEREISSATLPIFDDRKRFVIAREANRGFRGCHGSRASQIVRKTKVDLFRRGGDAPGGYLRFFSSNATAFLYQMQW